jgi:hypothetical protein
MVRFGNVSRRQRSGEAIFPIKSIYSMQLFAELSLGRRRTNKHRASYEISLKREEEEEE